MNTKEGSRPATYRDLRHTISQRLLLRDSFDEMLERLGVGEQIASLWVTQQFLLRRKLIEKGASKPPTTEDFKTMEAARDYIRQRLPDRIYYAAILTVMEALPAGLGR